jgi:Domain of unknown function (DUF4136)
VAGSVRSGTRPDADHLARRSRVTARQSRRSRALADLAPGLLLVLADAGPPFGDFGALERLASQQHDEQWCRGAGALEEVRMANTATRLCGVVLRTAVLALVATGALAQDVNFTAMPGTDFTKYKTYRWVQQSPPPLDDDILDAEIIRSVDAQLAAKGLSKTDGDTADLYVRYETALARETQWNAHAIGDGPGWGGLPWGGGGFGTASSSPIHIGLLVVDIYDVAAKRLVWRGTAHKALSPTAKPAQRTKDLTKAVAKMLANYPPPAGK